MSLHFRKTSLGVGIREEVGKGESGGREASLEAAEMMTMMMMISTWQ